ncbi:MAG: MerR family transcriptional regulator [Acutalibacteraceae bacterium]
MPDKLYTAGELAKMAGVSLRTVRFYDSKGILKPIAHSDSGYRYYDCNSVERLQKILMMKFIGFSLEQIQQIMSSDGDSVKLSLAAQKNLLLEKKAHIEAIISAIDEAQGIEGDELWEKLSEIMKFTAQKEKIITQYADDSNLQRRINIHAYSTAETPWMQWVFDRLEISGGMKILEIGCGNALLWRENIDRIPENTEIYLTDYSQGMVESAENLLSELKPETDSRSIKFRFGTADANDLKICGKYDLVIANHVLYHVRERGKLLERVHDLLTDGGRFCCTTIGQHHMEELNRMLTEFSGEIQSPFFEMSDEFTLENGGGLLEKVFDRVEKEEQDSNLIVDDARAIYDYVYSYPGNVKEILDKRGGDFIAMIREKIEKEGAMFIRKSQGIFTCSK